MEIGDRVVYPMHGAGEIVGVEENEVDDVKQTYYVLQIRMGNLRLLLPVDKVEEIGVRGIIEKSKVKEVAKVLTGRADRTFGSWNRRFHATLDRMKTGDILEVAAVARNLTRQSLKRKLSGGEHRLMDLSRQILISELVYVFDKPVEDVANWVDEHIKKKVDDDEEEE